MADRGRPILHAPGDIRKRIEAVQPPDDRTYSAEVTVIRRNLLHHRIARIVIPYALKYDTMFFPACQAHFQKNLQKYMRIFVKFGEFFFLSPKDVNLREKDVSLRTLQSGPHKDPRPRKGLGFRFYTDIQ